MTLSTLPSELCIDLPMPNTENLQEEHFKDILDLLEDPNAPCEALETNEEKVKKVVEFQTTQEDKDVCDMLLGMSSGKYEKYEPCIIVANADKLSVTGSIKKVRKAPMAFKICPLCDEECLVHSRTLTCTRSGCQGRLVLKYKEPKILKRAAPLCKKWCNQCNDYIHDCNVASQTCKVCKVPKSLVMHGP